MAAENEYGPAGEAIYFLELLRPGGPWVLTAIIPDGHTETITATSHEDVILFVEANNGRRNCYYSVNPIRTALTSKAKKIDIKAIEYLYADLDPRHDESAEAAKERYLAALAAHHPLPTAIINSGNGIQALWKLAVPIVLPDPSSPEWSKIVDDVEGRMKALMQRLGSVAGTQNIDRILRLPGTLNIPNKTKLKGGRVRCPTAQISFNGAADVLDAFPKPERDDKQGSDAAPDEEPDAAPDAASGIDVDIDALPIPETTKQRIRDGAPIGERSEAVLAVCCEMIRCGVPDQIILMVLLDKRNRISDHIYDQANPRRYAQRQLARALVKQPRQIILDSDSEQVVVPVDLWGRFDPPTLPSGLLPPVIEQYAAAQSEMMGCDAGGLAVAALTVCAAAITDSIELRMKRHDPHWKESARLWTTLVGDPSKMKTPIMREAVRPLNQIDIGLHHENMEAMAFYEALPAEEKKKTPRPRNKRLRMEDTTIEAAQDMLLDSPDGVLCLQDELSGWFGAMDKYSGPRGAAKDRGFWMQAYNGGSYAINRITRGASIIPNLSISILGGIQPEPLLKIITDAQDDGLIQRLLPILLPRMAAIGKDEPQLAVVNAYEGLVSGLHELQPPTIQGDGNLAGIIPVELRFDDAAQELRNKLEQTHRDLQSYEAINKKFSAHIGKYNGLFGRLCVLWHCVENVELFSLPAVVSINTAQRVATFIHKYLLPHAVAFYMGILGLSDAHERLTAVADYILAHKLPRITNRDVQQGDRTMRKLTKRDMNSVFEQLDALGWVSRVSAPRPSDPPHWIVNPEVHKRFAARAEASAKRRADVRRAILATVGRDSDAD